MIEKFAIFLDDLKNHIETTTEPRCYHCGMPYERDEPKSDLYHTTWKPQCLCLNKTTIRIVTGGDYEQN